MEVGINETKEMLAFGFKLQRAISDAAADGKVTMADAPKFFPVLMASPKAFGGINLIPAEIKDLNESEKKELLEFARAEFDLPNDLLEILIEDTLEAVLDVYKLALRWQDKRAA